MSLRKLFIVAALAFAMSPASASAQDWFVTPFIGGNFGGNANFGTFPSLDDEVERRVDFGATIGWVPHVVGFEVDFGFSPNFFEDTAGDRNFQFGDSNVTTVMGNLLVSAPRDVSVRPYASGGLGLIRSRVNDVGAFFDDLTTNDLGMNIGAGLNGQITNTVGIRGDIRYFRSLEDNEPDNEFDLGLSDFDFWRGTVGVTFRW